MGALQGHDQADEKCNKRDDGYRLDAHGHGLTKGALRTQALTPKRTDKGEIRGLASEVRQVSNVSEPIYRPRAHPGGYGDDSLRRGQREHPPIEWAIWEACLRLAIELARDSEVSLSSMQGLFLGFAYLKYPGQARELQHLQNSAGQAEQAEPLLGIPRFLEHLQQRCDSGAINIAHRAQVN